MNKKIYFIFSEKQHKEMRRIFAAHNKPDSKPETSRKQDRIKKACIPLLTEKKADTAKIEHVTGTIETAPKKNTSSKKKDYFISVFDKKAGMTIKKVSGHILYFEGLEFGLNRTTPKEYYTITDILTGCAIGQCKTIKNAFDVLTPDLLAILRTKQKEQHFIKHAERIREAYDNDRATPFC